VKISTKTFNLIDPLAGIHFSRVDNYDEPRTISTLYKQRTSLLIERTLIIVFIQSYLWPIVTTASAALSKPNACHAVKSCNQKSLRAEITERAG
jgi:hypothetical protein